MVDSISKLIEKISPYYSSRAKKKEAGLIDSVPEAEHTLVYDSSSETLEPIYFFITDTMVNFGLNPEKLIDSFSSTTGSPIFSETGIKASRIQDEAMKIMGSINAVLRSILNLIYDLRDFKTRLESYDLLKSKNKDDAEAARLSLKQIWMDKVDVNKGNSSIKAMALSQMGYQTLIDAFLICKTSEDVDKLDLNDRVKRIVKPRVHEFNIWVDQSEKELRKRYELEKTYLKSQVASLKIYSRWVKPYLKSSQNLEMKDNPRNAYLVNMFNTIILELTLFGKSKLKIKEAAIEGNLPSSFKTMKTKRDYYSCILVDFVFKAIPKQGTFVGRSEITIRAYSLNDDEIKKLNYELEKSDVGEAFSLIEGATSESIEQLQSDIDYFLNEQPEKESKNQDDVNPFLALFGWYNSPKSKKNEKKENKNIIVSSDNWIEKEHLRKLTANNSADICFNIFDIYKKAHGMPSYT